MKDFQKMNCEGCYFADPDRLGTGEPCCTYPGKLEVISGRCQQQQATKPELEGKGE